MKIEEEISEKVQEIDSSNKNINNTNNNSEEPTIQDESNSVNVQEHSTTHQTIDSSWNNVSSSTQDQSENKGGFVKLNIEEEDSSEEEPIKSEDIKLDSKPHIEEISEAKRITEFDKNLMKHENVSDEFIHSFDNVHVTEIPQANNEKEIEEEKKEEKIEITPEEEEEIKLLVEIDKELEKYKADAKEQHTKGMFELSIELYEEGLLWIEQKEHLFKHKIDDIVIRKWALWSNIAAWYKQYHNSEKEIEFSTLVLNSSEHLKNEQNLLFKAYYRRGVAYEKSERYKKAFKDLEVWKSIQPYSLDVTKALNRVREALKHEEQLEKIKSKPSATKLTNMLEEFKVKGNDHYKENKIGILNNN